MRVLAADDDPTLLAALERALRNWGYDVVSARDGTEAWTILRNEDAPRVIVLDWDMPGLSGLEVCRLLRGTPHGEGVYVVMLTGRHQKNDLIEALEVGADDFLSKPFHPRELQLRLARGVALQASRAPSAEGQEIPPSGAILGGKYRLEKQIAEGGMAKVWLGVHLSLGINVAIKFMKPGLADAPDNASFEREARAAAKLRSEHVVRIYDHGFTSDGTPYLVMDYLPGESLAERIDRLGAIAPVEVAEIVEQIARALTEAHGHGIVHGDVKPQNILLVEDAHRPVGCAKLVDFGLARLGMTTTTVPDGGIISGTPSYMTPEHLRALAPPNTGLDLWGLATTGFTALTGKLAFEGDTLRDLVQAICVSPLPIPSVRQATLPPAIDAWFARACARSPSERYQTPAELAAGLAAACAEAAGFRIPKTSGTVRAVRLETPDTLLEKPPSSSQVEGS